MGNNQLNKADKYSVTTVRIGKTSKYRVFVDGEFLAVVEKIRQGLWETGDSSNGFSGTVSFPTLTEAAEFHEASYRDRYGSVPAKTKRGL